MRGMETENSAGRRENGIRSFAFCEIRNNLCFIILIRWDSDQYRIVAVDCGGQFCFPVSDQSERKNTKCPRCGAVAEDNSSFCLSCTASFKNQEEARSSLPQEMAPAEQKKDVSESPEQPCTADVTLDHPASAQSESKMPSVPDQQAADSSDSKDPNPSLEKNVQDPAEQTTDNDSKARYRRIRLIVGTIIIVIGIFRIGTAGSPLSSTTFGDDFYTYAYKGIVAAELLSRVEVSLGWILDAIGDAIDLDAFRH